MARVHSYYENLRVARNAPPEVIRAAYRALSQRYHPDRNPGDAQAARVMTLINVAYHTLSDPELRAQHDDWISTEEGVEDSSNGNVHASQSTNVPPTSEPPKTERQGGQSVASPSWERGLPFEIVALVKHLNRRGGWYSVALISAFIYFGNQIHRPAPQPPIQPVESSQARANDAAVVALPITPAKPVYIPPSRAPNGRQWPKSAAYVQGYPRLNNEGHGEVTVDNSQNESDVFCKIVSLAGIRPLPVRYFFIPAGKIFTATGVTPGAYDVRYLSLASGAFTKTDQFMLTETETEEGVRYKSMQMTLYKVQGGNMQTVEISEAEFE